MSLKINHIIKLRVCNRHLPAKLAPTFVGRGVSSGQRNGPPRPLISFYEAETLLSFIQVATQLIQFCRNLIDDL
jgi:hypothetical protein